MFSASDPDTHLGAPLFLTWTQLLVAVVGCYAFAAGSSRISVLSFFPKKLTYDWNVALSIMPLSLIYTGMLVCNNLTLQLVEVSFYQVARSLTIMFNIAVQYFVFNKPTSKVSIAGCLVVVVGYVVATDGEVNVSVQGLFFGCLSSLFVALYAIYVKKSLALLDENQWMLMYYNNVNASLLLPFLIVGTELDQVSANSVVFTNWHFYGLLLTAGVFGSLINIASFLQIKYTSPLTHNVSGTFKACLQTVIAAWVFQNATTGAFWSGFFLTMLGTSIYSYAKFTEMK